MINTIILHMNLLQNGIAQQLTNIGDLVIVDVDELQAVLEGQILQEVYVVQVVVGQVQNAQGGAQDGDC